MASASGRPGSTQGERRAARAAPARAHAASRRAAGDRPGDQIEVDVRANAASRQAAATRSRRARRCQASRTAGDEVEQPDRRRTASQRQRPSSRRRCDRGRGRGRGAAQPAHRYRGRAVVAHGAVAALRPAPCPAGSAGGEQGEHRRSRWPAPSHAVASRPGAGQRLRPAWASQYAGSALASPCISRRQLVDRDPDAAEDAEQQVNSAPISGPSRRGQPGSRARSRAPRTAPAPSRLQPVSLGPPGGRQPDAQRDRADRVRPGQRRGATASAVTTLVATYVRPGSGVSRSCRFQPAALAGDPAADGRSRRPSRRRPTMLTMS